MDDTRSPEDTAMPAPDAGAILPGAVRRELDALFDSVPDLDSETVSAAQTVALWGEAAAATDPGATLKAVAATAEKTRISTKAAPAAGTKTGTRTGLKSGTKTGLGTTPKTSIPPIPLLRADDTHDNLPTIPARRPAGSGKNADGVTLPIPLLTSDREPVDATVMLTINPDGTASMTMPGASVTLSPRSTTLSSGGEYEIGEVIGSGGMGVVNLARQASLDRRIVVKSIRDDHADRPDAQQKFITEALATASLDHPNVVPIHDMGVGADGHLFYVMKEVKGDTWRKRMRGLSEQENIDILLRVCDAVACAHDRGIIHRDLKPDNVMLGDYGEVLLMDWGLAAAISPSAKAAQLTDSAACAGTPSFMAPEMARGLVGGIGAWSDQYLLGAILYTILTGRPPHQGKTAQEAIVNAANNILAPSARDDEWIKVARRAMQTQPYQRYPSVKEFQAALRSCRVHHESIVLTSKGDEHFAAASAAGDHEFFGRAIAAYEQALVLWPENDAAVGKLREARFAYARRAFDGGDYHLVVSLLQHSPDKGEADLIARANREMRQIATRRRRVRLFGALAVGALALVAAVSAASYVLISRQADAERRARAEAEELRTVAEEQFHAAERERENAENALATAQEARAAEARANELRLRDQEEKLAAEERARQRAEEALAAREEIQRMGYLEDNSRWRFTPEEAVARRAADAEKFAMPLTRSLAVDGVVMEFALIPSGFFVMGSPPRDPARNSDEYLHEVELTTPFLMGKTEVTRAQWRAVVGVESDAIHGAGREAGDPSGMDWRTRSLTPSEESLPATGVSYNDIFDVFLPALERKLGGDAKGIRLPTEAEWEWAARAGAIGHYYTGDTEADLAACAWYDANSSGRIHPVGEKIPNAWGLHDVLGNVWEFTLDSYDALFYLRSPRQNPVNLDVSTPSKVSRGGSYINSPRLSRISCRSTYTHERNRYPHAGFRLAVSAAVLSE